MEKRYPGRLLTRRELFRLGGGVMAAAAGSALLPRSFLQPERVVAAEQALAGVAAPLAQGERAPDLYLAATDGWININAPAIPPYFPDDMAPAGLNTYIFGFRDVTAWLDNPAVVQAQKMKAQMCGPIFWLDQEQDFLLKLTNLGLQIRPDLIDSHTLHFHGFRNAIPIFDGEPHSSVGVPIIRHLNYFYRPHNPGTYMYHCHFEETEHVHMGMIGPCFIRPLLNQTLAPRKFAYNDESTEYDREFVVFLSDIWAEAHWCDSHIQLPEWTDYKSDLFLLNGRSYPDTLLPNGGPADPATGELPAIVNTERKLPADPLERPDLRYQPVSGLIQANAGERILLRFTNLAFTDLSMRLPGIKLRVVGRDAMLLKGRDGTDLTYTTSTPPVGPGETVDAIFVAPPFKGTQGLTDYRNRPYDRYLLYNRMLNHVVGGAGASYGGQMTEVRVYQPNALGAQQVPNGWGEGEP